MAPNYFWTRTAILSLNKSLPCIRKRKRGRRSRWALMRTVSVVTYHQIDNLYRLTNKIQTANSTTNRQIKALKIMNRGGVLTTVAAVKSTIAAETKSRQDGIKACCYNRIRFARKEDLLRPARHQCPHEELTRSLRLSHHPLLISTLTKWWNWTSRGTFSQAWCLKRIIPNLILFSGISDFRHILGFSPTKTLHRRFKGKSHSKEKRSWHRREGKT